MDLYDEDNYELICQPTDDGKIDMRENVLVSENKQTIITNTELNYSFNDLINSVFFQILIAMLVMYLIYYLWQFAINLVSSKKISLTIKGGGLKKYSSN